MNTRDLETSPGQEKIQDIESTQDQGTIREQEIVQTTTEREQEIIPDKTKASEAKAERETHGEQYHNTKET